MQEKRNTIWITGASSGIGYSLTSKLLQEGNIIIATARHIAKLKNLESKFQNKLFCFELDVSNETAIKEFCAALKKQFGSIDTMILNAGVCEYLEWPNFDLDILRRNMDTNFWGVANCIAYGLNLLDGASRPYIVAISSAAHIIGIPRAEGYGTSKAALHYLLQTLQAELYGSNINISIVTPGFVATELTAKNDFPMPFLLPVEKATDIILKGMKKRKTEIKFPILLIFILNLLNIMPDNLRNFILSKTVRRK